jgi:hypothetical protein
MPAAAPVRGRHFLATFPEGLAFYPHLGQNVHELATSRNLCRFLQVRQDR